MTRIFLDSSVLFSAIYSPRGHSRDLIHMGIRGEITLVVSELVLEETRRNLAQSSPDLLLFLDFAIENIPFEIVRPTKREVLAAAKHVALKDAPILAGAKRAGVDFLASLDKKHILGKPELEDFSGSKIRTPKEVFEQIKTSN